MRSRRSHGNADIRPRLLLEQSRSSRPAPPLVWTVRGEKRYAAADTPDFHLVYRILPVPLRDPIHFEIEVYGVRGAPHPLARLRTLREAEGFVVHHAMQTMMARGYSVG